MKKSLSSFSKACDTTDDLISKFDLNLSNNGQTLKFIFDVLLNSNALDNSDKIIALNYLKKQHYFANLKTIKKD